MTLFWASDTHLDHAKEKTLDGFESTLRSKSTDDVLIITGDISTSLQLERHLQLIADAFPGRIYFLLGNHDFWFGSFADTEEIASRAAASRSNLTFLDEVSAIDLGDGTGLVGDSGWYDARNGDYLSGQMYMNDWNYIANYKNPLTDVLVVSRGRADFCAAKLDVKLREAAATFKRVLVATHVPPFADLGRYRGRPTDPHALPWYSSKVMGETIAKVAAEFPDVDFTVMAGHTHESHQVRYGKNLIGVVRGAEYTRPQVMEVTFKPA